MCHLLNTCRLCHKFSFKPYSSLRYTLTSVTSFIRENKYEIFNTCELCELTLIYMQPPWKRMALKVKCAASSLRGSFADGFEQQCSILQSPVFLQKIWQSTAFFFLHLYKSLFIIAYVLMWNELVTDQQKYLNGLWAQMTLSSPFPLESIKNQLNFFTIINDLR